VTPGSVLYGGRVNSAAAFVGQSHNTMSTPDLLAQKLPRALRDRLNRLFLSPIAPIVMTLIFIATGIMSSLQIPLYMGADEGWHYAYVEHYALGRPFVNYNLHFTTGDPSAPYWQSHEAVQPPLYYILMGRIVSLVPRGDLMHEQVLQQGSAPSGMIGNYLPGEVGGLGTGHALAGHLVRFATVLMGAVVVMCAYPITLWLTRRAELAVFTTALIAFNPRIVTLSSVISNDMAAACTAALTLLMATRMVTTRKALRWYHPFLLGASACLCLLSKYSGGAVAAGAATAIVIRAIQSRHSLKWVIANGALYAVGALAIGGVYFAHNWQMYGDVLAWNKINAFMSPGATSRPIQNALEWLPFILKSYFAHPSFIFPTAYIYSDAMLYVLLMGLAGSAWLVIRRKFSMAFAPLLASVVVNIVAYGFWMSSRGATENMRFFSPTFIPITLLIAMGLLAFVPRRWHNGFVALVTVAYGLFTPISLHDTMNFIYALPRYLSETETQQILARTGDGRVLFENNIEMLDVQIKTQRVNPGDPVDLSIVWRMNGPNRPNATLMLDLRDDQDQTVASLNTYNVMRYSYVTRAWAMGRMLREDYQVTPPALPGKVLRILAGWSDDSGLLHPVGSQSVSVEIGRVKVRNPSPSISPDPAMAKLEGLVDLLSARLDGDAITLRWRAMSEPPKNYTIFIHSLDANQNMLGQHDTPFEHPAAYWDKGEVFEQLIEVRGMSLAHSIQLGVYDPQNGQRFRALKPDGTPWPDDSIVLR
jgi:hypothetical protein